MSMLSRTLVIVPALNESLRIGDVLVQIQHCLPEFDVVVVDDGSDDGTCDVAIALGVPVLSLSFHMGYGAALKIGYRYALQKGYHYVVQIDSDGQHEPRDAVEVLRPLHDNRADIVIGSPYLITPSPNDRPLFRGYPGGFYHLGRLLGKLLAKLFLDVSVTYPYSGFRALNQRAMHCHLSKDFPDSFADLNSLVMLRAEGLRIVEVPARIYAIRPIADSRYFSMYGTFTHVYRLYVLLIALVNALPARVRRSKV